jgi:hypothetical protein
VKVLAAAICFFISTVTASAQFFTGNQFNELCQKKHIGVGVYVAGVVDKAATDETALSKYEQSTEDSKSLSPERAGKVIANLATALGEIKSYCLPKGVIVDQVADVFCKYLKDNPAGRQRNAAVLVTAALNDAWPCTLADVKAGNH